MSFIVSFFFKLDYQHDKQRNGVAKIIEIYICAMNFAVKIQTLFISLPLSKKHFYGIILRFCSCSSNLRGYRAPAL